MSLLSLTKRPLDSDDGGWRGKMMVEEVLILLKAMEFAEIAMRFVSDGS